MPINGVSLGRVHLPTKMICVTPLGGANEGDTSPWNLHGEIFRQSKFPIAWIPIQMTGFLPLKIHSTMVSVAILCVALGKRASPKCIKVFMEN